MANKPKYRVENGVPVAQKNLNRKYPFDTMETGDSFLSDKQDTRVRAAATMYAKRHNVKFKTSKTENGIRVWRVE